MSKAARDEATKTFRITLLGTGSPRPTLDRHHPAALVEWGESGHMLVDAGDGVVGQLLAAGVLLQQVHNVALTHMHWDHILGLPCFCLGELECRPTKIDCDGTPRHSRYAMISWSRAITESRPNGLSISAFLATVLTTLKCGTYPWAGQKKLTAAGSKPDRSIIRQCRRWLFVLPTKGEVLSLLVIRLSATN